MAVHTTPSGETRANGNLISPRCRSLGCVRMGEFAWNWFEPEEGKYNFEPMRRAMDCAMRHGIKVILGTVSAVCPAWLYKKHPAVKGKAFEADMKKNPIR